MIQPPSSYIRSICAVLLAALLAASVHASAKERNRQEQTKEQKQSQDEVKKQDQGEDTGPDPNSGLLIGIMGDRSLEDFALTRERPLFTPTRHPPLPPPPPPPPPPPAPPKPPKVEKEKPPTPPSLRLVGVIMTDEAKFALLTDKERNVLRLGVGDEFEGWSVTKVNASSVELKQKDDRTVYRMFEAEDESGKPLPGSSRGKRRKRGRR